MTQLIVNCKQIAALMLLVTIFSSSVIHTDARHLERTPGSHHPSDRHMYFLHIDDHFGVPQVRKERTTCQEIVSSGKFCPYDPRFNGDKSKFPMSPLSMRSTSPWVQLFSFDSTRVQQEMHWTCCACKFCVTRGSNGRFRKDSARRSYPIDIIQPVTRVSRNAPNEENIPVGCTCAEPKLH